MDQNETVPAKFLLANIYEYSVAYPRDFNYIGIGSGPRFTKVSQFGPDVDQILPKFLIDTIRDPSKNEMTIRIVHIDNSFGRCIPFLHEYFAEKSNSIGLNFQFDDSEEMLIWRTEDHRIEIIFVSTNIYHGNNEKFLTVNNLVDDTWFLEKMIETTLHNKKKIIMQEFSGQTFERTKPLIYNNYVNTDKKDLFLDTVLMDDSCHCGMNIAQFNPLTKSNGNFYNFFAYSRDEMKSLIGTDPKINRILKDYFLKDYSNILNKHHINYTKKTKGESLMYSFPDYNESNTADEIMTILIRKLDDIIKILDAIGVVTPSIFSKTREMFANYKSEDVHKWRIAMGKMFN
jgi:hypothetical protein